MVAYLRGRLKPDAPQGIQSAIRRELILSATELDLLREGTDMQYLLRLAFAAHPRADTGALLNELQSQIRLANELRHYYVGTKAGGRVGNTDMVKLFKILESQGIFEALREQS